MNPRTNIIEKKKDITRNNLHDSKININIRKIIFPKIAVNKLKHLMIDEESIKYVTFAETAQEITNLIMNNLSDFPCPIDKNPITWKNKLFFKKMKKIIITDMTAGIGGNVLNFAMYFKNVNAIEIDPKRYISLVKNVSVYNYQNITTINADAIDILINNDAMIQDIVFFDPPWGGKNYKYFNNLRLKMGDYSIEQICIKLLEKIHNKILVLKLPINYDFEYFNSELINFRIFKYSLDKMTIIIIKNYPAIIY